MATCKVPKVFLWIIVTIYMAKWFCTRVILTGQVIELMYIIYKTITYCVCKPTSQQTHTADFYKSFWLVTLTIISHYISNDNYILIQVVIRLTKTKIRNPSLISCLLKWIPTLQLWYNGIFSFRGNRCLCFCVFVTLKVCMNTLRQSRNAGAVFVGWRLWCKL